MYRVMNQTRIFVQPCSFKNGVALEGPDTDQLKGKLRERDGQGVHLFGQRWKPMLMHGSRK